MSTYNYVVTAQKPTSVQFAVKGPFTAPDDVNLILSKGTRIEIFTLTPEGLKPVTEFGIYGRIAAMDLYRIPNRPTSTLFILTERYKFTILSYDPVSHDLITEATGDVRDRTGQPCDDGSVGIIDPEYRMIGLYLYKGMFKCLPLETFGSGKGKEKEGTIGRDKELDKDKGKGKGKEVVRKKVGEVGEAFNVRLEELQIISMTFLHGCPRPTLAILYQDTKEVCHVKSYEFNLRDKDKVEGQFAQQNVEPAANLLIAVPKPLGGALVVGEQTITYLNPKQAPRAISMSTTVMKTYGQVDQDGSRYLLGDFLGNLYILVLIAEGDSVVDLKLERLGGTSASSCLVYLDNGYAFVGSHYGDSQLIRLESERNEHGEYIEIIDRFTNLAPISDFCIVDLERQGQGQGQIVTCSGANKDGSLRIIRNGVGINEQAVLEMSGIKGIWSLRPSFNASHEDTLVISFIGETRVLQLEDEEMQEVEQLSRFNMGEITLATGNVVGDLVVQVTESSIRLMNLTSPTIFSEWMPSNGERITVACVNPTQVVASLGNGWLAYFEVRGQEIVEVGRIQFEHEIACLDIHPIDPASPLTSPICAVGLWTDISVRLLRLPTLEQLAKEYLGGEIIPRSILLAAFEGIFYLLIALGDGQLFNFILNREAGQLTDRKKVSLGTQPIILTTFQSNGTSHVFAASDRPTVIYSSNQKLLYSNVNLKEVGYMCPFNSASFPNSLAITTEAGLTIGTIDEIQKLHITTIPLGEMARRLCYQDSSRTFGLLTTRILVDSLTGEEDTVCFFRILDDQTFDVLDSHRMDNYEMVQSILTITFEKDPAEYYVVGTAFALPNEDEVYRGRLLVFQVTETRQLRLVHETEVKGCPYSMVAFNGKLLSGINSKIFLHAWNATESGNMGLVHLCSHHSNIHALYVATRGDFIIVGDLMRSISLLLYKPTDESIEEIARDSNTNWMTAVEVLDDDTFLGTEIGYNIFTVRKNSEVTSDEERRRLETIGEFHLGECVNRFRHGSLVMNLPDSDTLPATPTLLFGTINGVIGVIASLSQERFEFLQRVENNMTKVVKGVGGLDHAEWRSFSNDRRTVEARNFIDGDLIESFVDLRREQQQEVVDGAKGGKPLGISVEELGKLVEELMRIH